MRAYLPTEAEEQAILVEWLRARKIPFIVSVSGAILGGNKWGQIAKLKKMGWEPGAPDIILMRQAVARYGHKPVAIEMKRSKGGKCSPAQLALHATMREEGWIVIVAHGAQGAIDALKTCGIG